MFSINKLLTSFEELCVKFKEWHTANNWDYNDSLISYVVRLQDLARTYVLERGDPNSTIDAINESTKLPMLHEVSHLTKTTIGPMNEDLPIRHITVMDRDGK